MQTETADALAKFKADERSEWGEMQAALVSTVEAFVEFRAAQLSSLTSSRETIRAHTGGGMLEDVAIDVPMAPKLLGYVCASLVVEGVAEASHVAASAEKIDEGGMPTRREYVAAVLKELKARGKKSVGEYVKEGGIDLAKLLTGDEKFDGPLDAFLEKNGLKEIAP